MHTITPPTYSHLGQIFEYWAKKNPEQLAFLAPDRPSLTYTELDKQLRTLCETFQRLGLGPSARIAVLAPNGPELALAFLSCSGLCHLYPTQPCLQKRRIGVLP